MDDVLTEQLTRKEAVTLLELIETARQCSGIAGLNRLTASLDRLLSFDMAVCGMAWLDETGAITSQRIVNTSYPEEWLSMYAEYGFAAIDPVVLAHLAAPSSRKWSDAYRQWGRPHPFIALAEDFGIREGYSFGLLSPADGAGTIFSLCISGKPSVRANELLDILAPHFHEALRRAATPPLAPMATPLSSRETEVVRWLAEGKNSWEISMILGISERTVKFHTAAILKKLGAVNRPHAVALALSRGIIAMG